jgi:hypothetical protein
MNEKLQFEYGNEKSPKGNCFLYSAVLNDKFYFPGAKWIASNVYVSYLHLNDKLPVVAFPPVVIDSPLKVFQIAKYQNMDVLRIPDFSPPQDTKSARKYFQSRVDEFNEIVMKYVDLCGAQKMELEEILDIQDDGQKLNKIEKRFIQSMPHKNHSSLESILGPFLNDKLVQDNRFDFQNLWALYLEMEPNQSNIVHLFFEKYRAVLDENYEKAGIIQVKINDLIK